MTTKIETIREISEAILADQAPQEVRLRRIVMLLGKVWALGKAEGLALRDKE